MKANEELLDYDINLTPLQDQILVHLVGRMLGTTESFWADCSLFRDICSVFKGHFIVSEKPIDFVPAKRTRTMIRLLQGDTLFFLENKTEVRVAGVRCYKFLVEYSERNLFRSPKLQPRNLLQDQDNPLRFSFFMA